MKKLLIFAALVSAVPGIAAAQVASQVPIENACPAEAPVILQPESFTPAEPESVLITNRGTQPITGVVLSWRVTDSDGNASTGTSAVDFGVSGNPLAIGETSKSLYDASVKQGLSIKTITVSCTTVLFSGGKAWGDMKAPAVLRMLAMRQGATIERQRLLKIYKEDGSAKLLEELNKPIVR